MRPPQLRFLLFLVGVYEWGVIGAAVNWPAWVDGIAWGLIGWFARNILEWIVVTDLPGASR